MEYYKGLKTHLPAASTKVASHGFASPKFASLLDIDLAAISIGTSAAAQQTLVCSLGPSRAENSSTSNCILYMSNIAVESGSSHRGTSVTSEYATMFPGRTDFALVEGIHHSYEALHALRVLRTKWQEEGALASSSASSGAKKTKKRGRRKGPAIKGRTVLAKRSRTHSGRPMNPIMFKAFLKREGVRRTQEGVDMWAWNADLTKLMASDMDTAFEEEVAKRLFVFSART